MLTYNEIIQLKDKLQNHNTGLISKVDSDCGILKIGEKEELNSLKIIVRYVIVQKH